jgi:hypothetical protein
MKVDEEGKFVYVIGKKHNYNVICPFKECFQLVLWKAVVFMLLSL